MLHLGTAMSVLEIPIGEVAEASLPDAETRHQSKHEGRERGLHASAAAPSAALAMDPAEPVRDRATGGSRRPSSGIACTSLSGL